MKAVTRELVYDFEVSFDLVDAGGVVYHPKYFILLERARYHFWKQIGLDLIEHFNEGSVFVVAELQGKYRLPLMLAQEYSVLNKILKVTSRSIKVKQYILSKDNVEKALSLQDDSLALEKLSNFAGELHLVHANMKEMKATPIQEQHLEELRQFCVTQPSEELSH